MRPVLAALLLAAIGLVAVSSEASKLEPFCRGEEVGIKTIDELDMLIEEANSAGSSCPPRLIEALNDMKAITSDRKGCTLHKAEAITRFVDQHLKRSTDAIPSSLADFAVNLGMQTSRACSLELINSFSPEVEARLDRELGSERYNRFRASASYLMDDGPIGIVVLPSLKTNRVILPAVLMQLMSEMGANKLKVQLAETSERRAFADVCTNVLRPLYEPTLLPLARLARAGFLGASELEVEQDISLWSTAVVLCESLKMVELTANSGREEQINIAIELVNAAESLAKLREPEASLQLLAESPIELRPRGSSRISNEVVSDSISPLVRELGANQNEIEHIREAFLTRVLHILREVLGKGKNGQAFEKMLNLIKAKRSTEVAKFEEAKRPLVELVESTRSTRRLVASSNVCSYERKSKASFGDLIRVCRKIWSPVTALISASFILLISVTCLASNAVLSLLRFKQKPKYSLLYFIRQYFAPSEKQWPKKAESGMDSARFESLRSSIGS